MSEPPLHIVFAGGGTGGHIYPALAIAEHAARLNPRAAAHVLCSNRKVDAEILTAEAVPFTPLPAMPPVLRPGPLLRFLKSWGPSVAAARRVLDEKARSGPVVLVAMGGFVCPPAVRAARRAGLPVALVNLDAVPGKANRQVARKADRIDSAAEVAQGWRCVGPIVRPALTDPADPAVARARFGLDPAARTLLVTGGSQGAQSINELVIRLLADHPAAFKGWQVIHQTGAQHDHGPVRAAYQQAGVRAWVHPYIKDMPDAWAAADLSIGRCGAGTVAEAWATRTPAVFLPYPYHADEHQKRNAQPLVRAGSAVVLTDHVDPGANAAAHAPTLVALLTDPARFAALAEPARRLPPTDGARQIAAALLHRLETGSFSDLP